jgi:hypothetical protein
MTYRFELVRGHLRIVDVTVCKVTPIILHGVVSPEPSSGMGGAYASLLHESAQSLEIEGGGGPLLFRVGPSGDRVLGTARRQGSLAHKEAYSRWTLKGAYFLRSLRWS